MTDLKNKVNAELDSLENIKSFAVFTGCKDEEWRKRNVVCYATIYGRKST